MTHALETYGYILLFAFVAIEGMGVPVPGETALATAAVLASRGRLSIVAVIVVGAAAAITGDNTGYWIARLGGRAALVRIPIVRDTVPRLLPRGERFFARYGSLAVLGARFFAGLRITAAWLAGISHMRWPRFFVFNAAGGILWATFVGVVAYVFGQAVEAAIARYGLYAVLVLIVLAAVAFVVYRRRRSRARQREPER